ncbi:MAG: flagellar hook protein FlgE [Acidobacteria bacterium]|nr:flagellar hook protein FlgE [Acidobacteriota bacterium]
MLTSFYTALTGLDMNALAINVVGNNLANVNTTAFKGSRPTFAELIGGLGNVTAGDGNPIQVGLGITSPGVSPIFSQGSIQYTGRATDVGINGNGFFVVSTGTGVAYTRAGNFGFNNMGELINPDGFRVTGYLATSGVINNSVPPSAIQIALGASLPPQPTSALSVTANLDSQAAVDDTFSTAVQVYDSLGDAHTVTFTFTKTGPIDWDWTASIPALDTGGTATDPPVDVGTGSFSFSGTGILSSPAVDETLAFAGLANGADDMDVTFSLFDANGNPRFTGFAAPSGVSAITQDGYASSVLRDINIDSSGVIRGIFDNGQVKPLAQLALANFSNVEGLLKFTGSTFVTSPTSGEPSIGTPGTGGRGSVSGSSLELSNVDIAEEFTALIIAQRGYQANSRIISTTDELYQEAINLVR